MDFEADYLTKQIIAYIGNKRKLLFLIFKAIEQTGIELKDGLKFADLFCGSGVVSRFAKSLGFEVFCNDWESYATVIAEGFVKTDRNDIEKIFGSRKEFLSLLEKINSLKEPEESEQYIAKFYAPHSDDILKADYTKERLFYTRQNALSIDKIRNYIEKEFPAHSTSQLKRQAFYILTANLLYEAATHTNTNGVFKAFHKEFGGHGKDALKRILSPIQLNEPVLIDSKAPVHVFNEDANKLVKTLPEMDFVYLDPPYNQHQYGSNYHILNTIVRWDKIPEPLELNESGVLKNKAGIRSDWINTRSAYCYKQSAIVAFEELIKNVKAHFIFISYSSDGIIPFEQMKRICLSKGYVSIVTSTYTTYRGGKQSNCRVNSDIEFILVIDTKKRAQADCEEKIDRIVLEKKILMTLKRRFCSCRIEENFKIEDEFAVLTFARENSKKIRFLNTDNFLLNLNESLEDYSNDELEKTLAVLEKCLCQTKQEELFELFNLCKNHAADEKKYARAIPATLKKLAQKKYKETFYEMFNYIQSLKNVRPDLFILIETKLDEIKTLAEIRFNT